MWLPSWDATASRYAAIHARTTFQSGFFITKDLERDLKHPELQGVLPILLAFLSRLDCRVRSVDLLELDPQGRAQPAKGRPGAVRIRFRALGDRDDRELWYLRSDLSNGALHRDGRILAFARSLDHPHTYLKSASYLMHRPSFTTFRSFLLKESRSVLQDDSGIPLRSFDEARWSTRCYGTYQAPIALFKEYAQKELAERFRGKQVRPLDFGLGYRHRGHSSNLELALAPGKGGPAEK